MKFLLSFIVSVLLVSVISCKDHDISIPKTGEIVDYKVVDSLMNASGRYWVIEKITRVTGKEELEYISDNNSRNESLLGVYWHGAIIAGANLQFYKGNIRQQDGGGVFGPLPYMTTGKFHVYHLSDRFGAYSWANDHSKVNVTIPELLQSILRHISKVDPVNFEGYLDPSSYPVYGNVEAIKTAGKSERIKIIMDSKDRACS